MLIELFPLWLLRMKRTESKLIWFLVTAAYLDIHSILQAKDGVLVAAKDWMPISSGMSFTL